jgi:hypothetical protein
MITFDMIPFFPRRGGDGIQGLVVLNNGYTLSIVKGEHTYGGDKGLYEMAIFYAGNIVEEHPILEGTSGVVGWLDEKEVEELIKQLRRYRPAGYKTKNSCLSDEGFVFLEK